MQSKNIVLTKAVHELIFKNFKNFKFSNWSRFLKVKVKINFAVTFSFFTNLYLSNSDLDNLHIFSNILYTVGDEVEKFSIQVSTWASISRNTILHIINYYHFNNNYAFYLSPVFCFDLLSPLIAKRLAYEWNARGKRDSASMNCARSYRV